MGHPTTISTISCSEKHSKRALRFFGRSQTFGVFQLFLCGLRVSPSSINKECSSRCILQVVSESSLIFRIPFWIGWSHKTGDNTSYTVCRATAWVQALTLWLDFEPIMYKSADVNGLLTKCRSCMGLIQQQNVFYLLRDFLGTIGLLNDVELRKVSAGLSSIQLSI